MGKNQSNRELVIDALRKELVGPDPRGECVSFSSRAVFADLTASLGPWKTEEGQEVLQRDRPTKRYGIGVLYPFETPQPEDELNPAGFPNIPESSEDGSDQQLLTPDARKELEILERKDNQSRSEFEDEDLDLSSANTYRPSSMAVSSSIALQECEHLVVKLTGGRYKKVEVEVAGASRDWWIREPVTISASFTSGNLATSKGTLVAASMVEVENAGPLEIKLEAFTRPSPKPGEQLITFCAINRTGKSAMSDDRCLFQTHFSVTASNGDQAVAAIKSYPSAPMEQMDDEEQNLALLYRNMQTYAIGHGCAAEWGASHGSSGVSEVSAECLPRFEAPSVAPDVLGADGQPIAVSMASLAGLIPGTDGLDQLERVLTEYAAWIEGKKLAAAALEPVSLPIATKNLENCSLALSRMQKGLVFLRSNPEAMNAFRLANHAILLQQARNGIQRDVIYDPARRSIYFDPPYSAPDPIAVRGGKGNWRAFQIAFFLMSLESTANGDSEDRDLVELIWFPTGGGKTEAYLGLSAFSMFLRRLRDPGDTGVDVLMRYTLRLLTAQQFQRAAGLICAMESIRAGKIETLGIAPFSIGIWLGGDTTPNSKADAAAKYSDLVRNPNRADNPFLVGKCPWCAAQMGVIKFPPTAPRSLPRVFGYEKRASSIVFRCPDRECLFHSQLPIVVVDEEIYAGPPTLLIGTVDKFAMLTWRPEAKALFGIGRQGERISSPPTLIIQDELHLISGPLGTMVGLYEVLIDELCTDRRGVTRRSKIVSSTATIRRYEDQIRSLYARENVSLFPPPGLDAGDSFFARYATESDGTLSPGRLYVGVHAPGLGSMQTTQVRTFCALLQEPMTFPSDERDPWWSLVAFFNSLRELGTTLTLFQSDIPDYLKAIKNRTGMPWQDIRRIRHVIELTGRLSSEQIPSAIAALETPVGVGNSPVDVCLASNILEVGIDIDRLSIMTVVGQPKTTSQYIQVTGRVGRRWFDRPGLVITLYGASKPRDRSHFEKFRTYHERLYAQVEPTSVTPYSPPALDRALHGVMVGYVRQTEDVPSPYPVPEQALDMLRPILENRVLAVDPQEYENLRRLFEKRVSEWRRWERNIWEDPFVSSASPPLLRAAGAYCSAERERLSWPTAQSMRSVDAECQVEITTLYIDEGAQDA